MSAATARPLELGLNIRLSTMMFLQYAIWGAWLPFLWSFLSTHRGMSGDEIGNMFAAGAVGAIVGPFLAGQVADRHFATERFLALSHIAGAVLIWQLATIESTWAFLAFSLVYGLVYAPTLALTNSLAFHHLPDRDRDFGKVRLWGTFGWIAVGLMMGQWLARAHTPDGPGLTDEAILAAQAAGKADAFRLSAILGAVMGVFCLTLPHTPPSKGERKNATLEALGETRRQPLLTLFLLAVPVSCIHQFYFVHTEAFLSAKQLAAPEWLGTIFGAGGGGLMTVGQMWEVLVLGAIPLVTKRFSRKTLLAAGLVAYALRMALFAYVDAIPLPTMVTLLTGIALHGFCFGCFIFVAFMVVDEETTPDVRASAQNLFNLVIVGIGVIVGSKIAGSVADWATAEGASTPDYTRLFGVPLWASLACLVLLLLFYPSKARTSAVTS
jgi:nucleoside transporter